MAILQLEIQGTLVPNLSDMELKKEYADWLSDTRKITNDWDTKKYMLNLKP